MTNAITLERNAFGQLIFIAADGVRHPVSPVRSFPIAAPTEGIGLVNAEGEEVGDFLELHVVAVSQHVHGGARKDEQLADQGAEQGGAPVGESEGVAERVANERALREQGERDDERRGGLLQVAGAPGQAEQEAEVRGDGWRRRHL